jgi:hypothetical protein
MAKAPKNYNDDDEPRTAPKAAEPAPPAEPSSKPAATVPLEPSGGGDGEIPSQLVPYPTQEDVAKTGKVKEK